jgi:hypothetical protein
MKLRFRKNSLRLRLNRKEVAGLANGRAVEEYLIFPAGAVLRYRLEASPVARETSAEFSDSLISITIPSQAAIHWLGAEDIGLYYSLPSGEAKLDIAIEKDLECVEGPADERDPDAFPRKPSC